MFKVEGKGFSRYGAHVKEEWKLFGQYPDHKSYLPKLEVSGIGIDVNFYNESMERKF